MMLSFPSLWWLHVLLKSRDKSDANSRVTSAITVTTSQFSRPPIHPVGNSEFLPSVGFEPGTWGISTASTQSHYQLSHNLRWFNKWYFMHFQLWAFRVSLPTFLIPGLLILVHWITWRVHLNTCTIDILIMAIKKFKLLMIILSLLLMLVTSTLISRMCLYHSALLPLYCLLVNWWIKIVMLFSLGLIVFCRRRCWGRWLQRRLKWEDCFHSNLFSIIYLLLAMMFWIFLRIDIENFVNQTLLFWLIYLKITCWETKMLFQLSLFHVLFAN